MILQGVGHPIPCLGVCYANDPKKGGYTPLAPALDLTTSLRGDFITPSSNLFFGFGWAGGGLGLRGRGGGGQRVEEQGTWASRTRKRSAAVDGLRTEVCGQQIQSNDPHNIQHSPNTPTTGLRERGNDNSKSTGRSGRQNAATRRNMRRDERVTVQGPVKKQPSDGVSHRGSAGSSPPPPNAPDKGTPGEGSGTGQGSGETPMGVTRFRGHFMQASCHPPPPLPPSLSVFCFRHSVCLQV